MPDHATTTALDKVTGLESLVFFGGGRWGTVLFSELVKQLDSRTELLWVTKHAKDQATEWVATRGFKNIQVLEEWHGIRGPCDGGIVATSVDRHHALCRALLDSGVPVLCEKPVAGNRKQLEELLGLATDRQLPFGIHLEFAFLTAWDHFLAETSDLPYERIDVEWFDPEYEMRQDVEKWSEFQCDIIHDQVPHIWSLLSRALPCNSQPRFENVDYSPRTTTVSGTVGSIRFELRLSRRHASRKRWIGINEGEASFDFSVEPPTALRGDTPLELQLVRFRPLQLSLRSFLTQLDSRRSTVQDWILSVSRQVPILQSCFSLSEQLKGIQDNRLSQLTIVRNFRGEGADHLSDEEVQLTLDRWLPDEINRGKWRRPKTKAEQHSFAAEIIKRQFGDQ